MFGKVRMDLRFNGEGIMSGRVKWQCNSLALKDVVNYYSTICFNQGSIRNVEVSMKC